MAQAFLEAKLKAREAFHEAFHPVIQVTAATRLWPSLADAEKYYNDELNLNSRIHRIALRNRSGKQN